MGRRGARFVVRNYQESPRLLDTRDGGFDWELQQMRCDLAALDVELKLCKLAYLLRKYSADQPRVPAGKPEGGQWTSGSASGGAVAAGDEESNGSSGGLDEGRSAGASNDPGVDLTEDERLGGHAISRHVAKSDEFLKADVLENGQRITGRGDSFTGLRTGSFTSLDSATTLVNVTLAANREAVDAVARGDKPYDFVTTAFRFPTGYEAYLPDPFSSPYMRDTYSVGVYIRSDSRSARGYRVQSAYPMNP